MKRGLSQIGILTLAVALGCSDALTGPQTWRELLTHRALWARNGYHSYAFTIQMSCFCGNTDVIRAYVVNDSVVAAVDFTNPDRTVDPRGVRSIPRLFDFVANAFSENASTINVSYDPQLGFPSEIDYDGRVNIADDEITFYVSDVKPFASDPVQQIIARVIR